jgi:HSP20 family protein
MNLEKLKPWNWFKHENVVNNDNRQIPAVRNEAGSVNPVSNADSFFRLHREMDRLIDDMFNAYGMPGVSFSFPHNWLPGNPTSGASLAGSYRPQIDVSGNEKQYEIALDVPGLSESDVSIEVDGNVLTIKGQKEEKNESKNKHFYRVERSYGSFQRTLSLPDDADSNDIVASLKNGVLKLEIPRRAAPASDVKRISIST